MELGCRGGEGVEEALERKQKARRNENLFIWFYFPPFLWENIMMVAEIQISKYVGFKFF